MELKRLYSTGTIIVICAIIATIQAASAAPTISIEPSYQSVSSGDMFTVNITVDPDGNAITGVDYILRFDNAVLKALNQNKGPFLGGTIVANDIDNPNGSLDYGEWRTGSGVTDPGVLTTIEFEAISTGISELHFEHVMLVDSDRDRIRGVAICNGRVGIDQPSLPFMISGYVFNENESVCNNPAVAITNLNTCREWAVKTNETSNYCRTVLASCADVIADDVLQFDATGCSQSNTTSHIVTQAEVVFGGFKLNITLEEGGVFDPVITSCDDGGNDKDEFYPGENVSVTGTGLAPNTNYTLWIQNDPVNDSEALDISEDPSGSQENVTTDDTGCFGPELIWINISAGSQMRYDIVVDNQNGTYNAASDGIDSASTYGIVAPIPELPGVVLVSIGLIGIAGLIMRRKDE